LFTESRSGGLPHKIDLDSICRPHHDASAEEIRIFGPHCTCQSECCGEYWPITFVSTAQSLSGFTFKDGVKFWLGTALPTGATPDSLVESAESAGNTHRDSKNHHDRNGLRDTLTP
jgi:hypothetical protein